MRKPAPVIETKLRKAYLYQKHSYHWCIGFANYKIIVLCLVLHWVDCETDQVWIAYYSHSGNEMASWKLFPSRYNSSRECAADWMFGAATAPVFATLSVSSCWRPPKVSLSINIDSQLSMPRSYKIKYHVWSQYIHEYLMCMYNLECRLSICSII